ncbi:MAG: hypothetical protein GY814_03220, partial [Gammaproteobacteria bacterium]|nr:hypothetical protein [Gammaproteobacteria bacterium]
MSQMSDATLLTLVSNAEQEASIYNGEFSKTNARLLKDYLQEPYGDEVQDQSSVVDSSVQDVVESDMPSLARVFLGTRQPIMFESNTESEAELKEVEEKNVYVNHLIMNQPASYSTIMGWLKDAEIQMTGIVKYFFEDTVDTKETSYENVNESELAGIVESL